MPRRGDSDHARGWLAGRRLTVALCVLCLGACATAPLVVATGSTKPTDVLGRVETRTDTAPAPSAALVADSAALDAGAAPATTAAAPTAAPASTAPPPATRPPLAAGQQDLALAINGVNRTFLAVVPAPAPAPRPLTIVLHGIGGRGSSMRSMGFEPLGAASGTVFVYPDGLNGAWNDGRPGMDPVASAMGDDLAFLNGIIDEMVGRAGVDPAKVTIVGFSNGSFMAARAACELSGKVVGVALVAGAGGADLSASCKPKQSLAVLFVNGTADGVVPYNGGRVADYAGRKRGMAVPVKDAMQFWSERSACTGTTETPVRAALSVTLVEAQHCAPRMAVSQYRVNGGAHEWYRVQGFDTTQVVWNFLSTKPYA